MKSVARSWPLFLLFSCTPSGSAVESTHTAREAESIETWKREALALRKEYETRAPDPWDNLRGKVIDLLDKPDPPAAAGPEVKLLPAGERAIAWPAPKEGVLTVRYRIERKDCSPGGSDMGCHLTAICPVETPGSAPVARRIDPEYVGDQTWPDVTVEKIEIPSARCELRLYARDHHASRLCATRGPKLPASWTGAAVIDVGTIGLDKVSCERDALADRMLLRGDLITMWGLRAARKK